jgi:hypothetical protein
MIVPKSHPMTTYRHEDENRHPIPSCTKWTAFLDGGRCATKRRNEMRVCWKKRNSAGRMGNTYQWVALLLNDESPDGDDPADSALELASIEARFLTVNIPATRAFHQGLFWERVRRRLDDLHIDSSERAVLASALADKVPIPERDWALWGVCCIPRYDARKQGC